MYKTHVIVVNRNCLSYLTDCIKDLRKQSVSFDLTIVDNGSNESGTYEFLSNLRNDGFNIIKNTVNKPLNHVWNEFAASVHNPYLCYLNNDVRIPSNFIEDSEKIFEQNTKVGITCHASNNPKYQSTGPLNFEYLESNVRQGWDFTIRKELFHPIPEELHWFCGDDWIYKKVHKQGFKAVAITSSPIIHFQGRTSRRDIKSDDYNRYRKMEIFDGPMNWPEQSLVKPKIRKILER